MKRLIIMLLIVSSAAVPTQAQSKSKAQKKYDLTIMTNKEQQYPLRVFRLLRDIRDKFGMKEGQTYSVLKNPDTGLIESAERITRFSCLVDELKTIDQVFMDDEPFSYQILHLLPGNTQQFDIKVVSADGQRSKTLPIRTKPTQEMWFLATKNIENPQLRDVYAIVWETDDLGIEAQGTIYGISSLRPDLYTKNMESNKRMFKIEGRVDENIKDSLYNIYIANTYDALNALGDNEYVACVPVVNKRFEWQTELDHPCVGRLRCIFPDGSLCSAWIDLDFVPGETYHITVHNGYYDDDVAYEQRVGRLSGKSLIAPQQESVTITGDFKFEDSEDDNVADTLDVETVESYLGRKLPPEEAAKAEARVNAIEADAQMIDETFDAIKNTPYPANGVRLESLYQKILTLSKSIDTHFQGLAKTAKDNCLSPNEQVEMYKFILDMYRDQNKKLNEASSIHYNKSAQKLQKYITSQIEKYLNEMSKL
ncbi:MAG: hypothetical protein Q4E58_12020 [Prevotellaceae bacterium]|nr:hypothetical protein [Prevotellaceae bacterium]